MNGFVEVGWGGAVALGYITRSFCSYPDGKRAEKARCILFLSDECGIVCSRPNLVRPRRQLLLPHTPAMATLKDFQRCNRAHEPSEAHLSFIYEIYKVLFHANDATKRLKQVVLESTAVCLYPLRVVCISEDALRHILKTRSAKSLKRGHPVSRADRSLELFKGKAPMPQQDFSRYYFENDTVALVTSIENNINGVGHWTPLYPVPEGRVTGGSFSVRLNKADLAWVDAVCSKNGIVSA